VEGSSRSESLGVTERSQKSAEEGRQKEKTYEEKERNRGYQLQAMYSRQGTPKRPKRGGAQGARGARGAQGAQGRKRGQAEKTIEGMRRRAREDAEQVLG
jgi:hypothetical protein